MTTADHVLASSLAAYKHFGERFMQDLAELDDSLWFVQPHGQIHHPAWTVGHLCVTGGRCVGMLGGTDPNAEDFVERFGNGSTPSGDASGHPSNSTLLHLYRSIHSEVHELAASFPAERLNELNPIERLRRFQPTLGNIVEFMLGAHEAYHIAQFFSWKRALEASR